MRITKILPSNWFFGTIFVLLSSVAPLFGQAGQNAVINLSGSKVNSIAFIDASNYQTTQHDICITIQTILANNASSNGITVDARGTWLSGNLTCLPSGENPWPA